MSGLRFESMADMPPRMRELYARQQMPGAAAPATPRKGSQGKTKYTAGRIRAVSCASTARRRHAGMMS